MAIVWETIRDSFRSSDGRFCVWLSQGYVRVGCHWWLIDRATDCQEWSFKTADLAKEKAEEILFCEDVCKKHGLIVRDGVYCILKDWAAKDATVLNRDTIRDKVTRFEANNALMKEK